MNPLRHMALDYVLKRLSGDQPRATRSATSPRASIFEALWADMQASTPLRERGRNSGVRASDADREEVVASLKRHYAEGRLDTDELTARVESAYGARCLGDLTPLTRDLPEMPPPAVAPPPRTRRTARPVLGLAAFALSAFLVLALVSALPAEMWAPLLMLVLPLATFAFVAILPLALLALPLLWILRGPHGSSRLGPGHRRHSILAETDRGWVGIRRL